RVAHLAGRREEEDSPRPGAEGRLALAQGGLIGLLDADLLFAPLLQRRLLVAAADDPAAADDVAVIDAGQRAQLVGQLRVEAGAVGGEPVERCAGAADGGGGG